VVGWDVVYRETEYRENDKSDIPVVGGVDTAMSCASERVFIMAFH
jgi:hypothetical protein